MYTSSSTYWSPLKPRIRIYTFEDTGYASPLYTYNAFTDVGSETKPIALAFDSQTTSVGDFSIEIEDSTSALDFDTFSKGNRVFIECSKDGITWEPAFKGLVRSTDQKLFATTGHNLIIRGYSYLIRLNERIVNTIKESAVITIAESGAMGEEPIIEYDRTDSSMFTNNLIHDLLTTDSNYIESVDDTQLYSIFKNNNILSSSIEEWIPRLDAQLVTLNSAINRILEISNGLVMLNLADDELMLYTADLVTPSTGIFLLTNQMNQSTDDADFTMYPLEPYSYNISYDYPDAGSRLIASIGDYGCPPEEPEEEGVGTVPKPVWFHVSGNTYRLAPAVQFNFQGFMTNLEIPMRMVGNNSAGTSATVQIYVNNSDDGYGVPTVVAGSSTTPTGKGPFDIYVDGVPGTPFPNKTTSTVILKQQPGTTANFVFKDTWYYLSVSMNHVQSASNYVTWKTEAPQEANHFEGRNFWQFVAGGGPIGPPVSGGTWFQFSGFNNYLPDDTSGTFPDRIYHKWLFSAGPSRGACGAPASIGADPVFCIAQDRNMSSRLGIVERLISDIPTYIRTAQTLREYMFNRVYYSAKPRFTFDFPSVSMPNRLPKSGDIIAHVDTRANVGLRNAPIQTGVINTVRYKFDQKGGGGGNDALGLRKLALTTTGIKRGSY